MLFLFDIDGTLLRGMPPVHREAICQAVWHVLGIRIVPADLRETAGMTDTAILQRILHERAMRDVDIEEALPQLCRSAADIYDAIVPDDLSPYWTPHVEETLHSLAGHGGRFGLVTGNIERIAWSKLRSARLHTYFAVGAFGDEASNRDELPALAIARASHHFHHTFAPSEVWVIGDTPLDIMCGRACGVRTIAVATGPVHSLEALRACQPVHAFADLSGLLALRW